MSSNLLSIGLPILKNILFPTPTPFFATFIVTWRCNVKCVMCDIWKKPAVPEMDSQEIRLAFKQLSNIHAIRITGGEPFLRKDIADIVAAVSGNARRGIVHITTNGILTDEIVNFVKIADARILHLKISLTAYGQNHDKNLSLPGAYQKVIKTIEALVSLREKLRFFLAIDHTITGWESYRDSAGIRAMCRQYNLSYLPVIAYKSVPLYSSEPKGEKANPETTCFGEFKNEELAVIFNDFLQEAKRISDFKERAVKMYYLRGLKNRLIEGRQFPHPRCIALNNHVRILPNGDIIVCLYNPKIIGNIKDNFKNIWNSSEAKAARLHANNCPGCWVSCETIPNAVYSGDLLKHLLW
jgi:MoaA/NifB/PqqE/SkfB family radical SAM enzyme